MKKHNYLFVAVMLLSLSGCDLIYMPGSSSSNNDYSSSDFIDSSYESNEDSSVLENSSSESIIDSSSSNIDSSSSNIDSSSEENEELIVPNRFYTIDVNDIIDTYKYNTSYNLKDDWICFIILDNIGRIVYTASNTKCGFGGIDMYYAHPYYQNIMKDLVNDETVTVPNGCIGYSLSLETYGKFANNISNGEIPVNEFDANAYGSISYSWNSLNNPYLDLYTGVKISETSSVELVVKNDKEFRLSSIHDNNSSTGTATYKTFVPYDDIYTLTCDTSTSIKLFNENKSLIAKGNNSVTVSLKANDIVYVSITSIQNEFFDLEVSLKNNNVELPYQINSKIDKSKISTSSVSYNPLKEATLNYQKRSDDRGLYVNSNNPENLANYSSKYGSIMNTVLMRQDVTEKDVFFTFEHNNLSQNYYYGYRVTNTSSKDVYITVKNLGYQVKGAGSWLGEDEWIKFYNTKFYTDTSSYTSSQKSNYNAYVGFSNSYSSANRKPITYRLPANKYIYVMGGTSKDAYNNINVFNSANVVVNGGCSNAAVLFSVTGGSAEASFMIYDDSDASTINSTNYVKGNNQIGYVSDETLGSQYGGYDNCHGVVDADIYYEFNDLTPASNLKVKYTNPYGSSSSSGTAYAKLSNLVSNTVQADYWYTHISYINNTKAVGTDMTDYINVDFKTKKQIEIDSSHYDGRGKAPNIGNWMVDYIDTFTLVNKGSKQRQFKVSLKHNGVILAFVRNEDGSINTSIKPQYYVSIASGSYGDEIRNYFTYTVTIPAHSYVCFSIDYNLLANSYGSIFHQVSLI